MHQVCLLPVEKKMRVAVLLWDWWATQNKTNAGTKQKTIEEASMLINKHLLEFSSMKQSPSPQPACQESRKPPEAGIVKINIDAAFREMPEAGAWGCGV